jgi:RNA polymerase-interacting CarD/CdnL/TRCF family regulator
MGFHAGDMVMHWTYGLGQVVHLEERDMFGSKCLYYAVQLGDLTVWVPEDGKLDSRLRPPTSADEFKLLLGTLSTPSQPLPDDRNERKNHLLGLLKSGRAESLCEVIRDLDAHQHVRQLNENDQTLLKQARSALLGEWCFVLSLTQAQVEHEMRRLLTEKQEVEK